MASRENLTDARIRSCLCEPGKEYCFVWDAKVPGLGIQVTQRGVKTYIFESRLNSSTIRMSIGSPDIWILESARKEARRLRLSATPLMS